MNITGLIIKSIWWMIIFITAAGIFQTLFHINSYKLAAAMIVIGVLLILKGIIDFYQTTKQGED